VRLFERIFGRPTNRLCPSRSDVRIHLGDIDAALTTASAIGDDTLQRQATGRVVPDSFTHRSAEQRKRWFMAGYQRVKACDTFNAGDL
jgi:uncharacterized protein